MDSSQLLTIAAALVAALFGLLVAVVSYLGSRVISGLDELGKKLDMVVAELHTRISSLDIRLTVVETKLKEHED